MRALGPAPLDPVEAILRANQLGSICMRSAAVDPASPSLAARRRAVLEGIRTIGMTNSKAVDKARLLRVEQRLGLAEKDTSDELETSPGGDQALRA